MQLTTDEVGAEAVLRLDDATEVVAALTRGSAEALALRPGVKVHVLLDAGAVMLGTGRELRTSAANQLWGRVGRVEEGPVQAEVALGLPGGLSLAAIVTSASLRRLGLHPGGRVCAVFQASSVFLASCA